MIIPHPMSSSSELGVILGTFWIYCSYPEMRKDRIVPHANDNPNEAKPRTVLRARTKEKLPFLKPRTDTGKSFNRRYASIGITEAISIKTAICISVRSGNAARANPAETIIRKKPAIHMNRAGPAPHGAVKDSQKTENPIPLKLVLLPFYPFELASSILFEELLCQISCR
uniref:Uncharacterized protein n=1 Tax=uncultured marine thaumarchaeote KM3_55_F05 TaxID=1456198 RepID=A0A075HB57_9ARCH|nr:hypothetical protein [uncultured marine thaumarchaeote KM3_55_F05]